MLTRKLLTALLALSLGTVSLAACNDSNPSAPNSESNSDSDHNNSDDNNDDSDSSEQEDGNDN